MIYRNICITSTLVLILTLILFCNFSVAQSVPSKAEIKENSQVSPWKPDNRNGTFKNPIIYADYSDPDVVRVGNDFYLTSSSFSNFPGLPILHSEDLVNWKIIGHAVIHYPFEKFNKP